MSANVEFNITAFDQASSVFEDVSDSATSCFTTVTTGANEAADSVETSSTAIADNQAVATSSFKDNALAMNTAALSAAGLVMGISSIENAEVSLDRAHVTVEKDTDAVTSAQNAYNKAVAEYGPNSKEAQDAADKLKAAQDALTVAQERVSEAQRNLNSTIMMSSLQIIPGVIGAFTSLSTLFSAYPAVASGVSAATDAIGVAMDFLAANPIILVVAGIAALAVGLYEAYEHFAPFRDAVNAVGAVLEGVFKVALTDIEGALKVIMAPIEAFESAINRVASAVKPLGNLIGDLTGALKGLCFAHAAPAAEEFNRQVQGSIELSNSLTQRLEPLRQGLMGVSGGAGNVAVGGVSGGSQHITVNPTINIGKIDRTTGLNDVINAVNQGTAQALARRF